jgi:hypothetical protein
MTPLIAFQRGPSRFRVFPGERTGTDGATTTGGRDKRRGTDARYVVVVVRYFPRRGEGHSAAPRSNHLFSNRFHRAALFQTGTLT